MIVTPIKTETPVLVLQVRCGRCDATYGIVQAQGVGVPHPRFCAFCASRATFTATQET